MNDGWPYGDGYDFKRCPFGMRNMAFYLLKGNLLERKRLPLANSSETTENRKQKQRICNKSKLL